MKVKEITEKSVWERFLSLCQEKTFFQSWAWGEAGREVGEHIWRFGIYEGGQLVAVAQTVKKTAKRGTYLELTHGPVSRHTGRDARTKIMEVLLETLKALGKEEGASFIRTNPLWERNEENAALVRGLGFRQAPMYASYESSWKLDITPGEEELMKGMRKTTRYLIRQAAKNRDIAVRQGTSTEDVEAFHALSRAVGKRQGFVPYSKEYLAAEVAAFRKDNAVSLFFGTYQGKAVAGALLIYWSGIGFYHQAASLGEYAKFSLPYLVQWEAIKEAKKRGCALYDFWGFVDPAKHPNHPWAGPTFFKTGFGGRAYEYLKTQDFPLDWKYWPSACFETVRRIRRGL